MCVLVTTTQAQVAELLTKFDEGSQFERVAIANNLFENFLAQDHDTTYRYSRDVNTEYLEGMVYLGAGEYYINNTQFDRAAICLERALPLLRRHTTKEELPDCISLLGIAYTRLGDFKTAMMYQEECLKLDRKSGDPKLISSSLNNIAATCVTAGATKQALKYIEEAVAIERTLNRPTPLAVRLGVASEIYVKAGVLDKALKAAQEALAVEASQGNPEKVPIRKSQLGAVYKAMRQNTRAHAMLHEAEMGLRSTANYNSLSITLNLLGETDIAMGNYQEAEKHLRESVKLCATTGNINAEISARRLLCQTLRHSNPTEAVDEIEKYAALKDSIYSREAMQTVALFNVKYENDKKQHEIEILEQRVKNNHLWLGILGLVLVGAIVITVLARHTVVTTQAKNKTLIKANLLKDELLELAQQQNKNDSGPTEKEKIVHLATEMGNMGEMPEVRITRREREIMVLCCQGLLAKEIADRLNISQRTVETHKTNLYKKLGINNNVELIRYAQAVGAIQ